VANLSTSKIFPQDLAEESHLPNTYFWLYSISNLRNSRSRNPWNPSNWLPLGSYCSNFP